jgi:hypothetical protein
LSRRSRRCSWSFIGERGRITPLRSRSFFKPPNVGRASDGRSNTPLTAGLFLGSAATRPTITYDS